MHTVLTASKNFFKGAVKPLKNNKGLTLMELLAVILILGIIAAMAIPVLSGQGEKSRVTAHESNLATIESAAERYATELGFNDSSATTQLGEIVQTHEILTEGYLKEIPNNPWEGTNHDANSYKYFIAQDERGVVYAVLVDPTEAVPFTGATKVVDDKGEVSDLSTVYGNSAQGYLDFYGDASAATPTNTVNLP